jgi:tellurite methyltransferase
MRRPISGFRQDEAADWVAELACGHCQHVRHAPPFVLRPWVASEAGRASQIGATLDCPLCERRELPAGWVAYRRTPNFDADSLPPALRSRHTTKPGIWARIHVLAGRLRYRLHEPFDEEQVLEPSVPGVILPGVEHEVTPLGAVRFYVEFHRREAEAAATGPRPPGPDARGPSSSGEREA